ncbi:MAG: hypothetical protein GY742_06320 [Hyphomicrobiales bacterium]|nr:hypothetical protein [Hyphomicrobiales bacterium]
MNINIIKISSLLITGLLASTSASQAAGHRPDTRNMSCGAAISLVQNAGAVILSTGPHLYDKYVANHAYCSIDQALERAYVPTTDTHRCKIGYRCREKFYD